MSSQALVVEVPDGGKPVLRTKSIPLPVPGQHQARVKVRSVAQNPTDVSAFDINAYGDGAVHGCDFAGVVEEVGPDVLTLAKGDKVAGVIWGGHKKGLGAFAEHTLVDERISFKIPPEVSFPQVSTVPLASITALLALFSDRCLDIDRNVAGQQILIWGGSSSVGLYAIQIAALYGLKVVTTCSPRHFELVKSLGAEHVFDYKSSEVVSSIKGVAPDLKYFFDTIGNESSTSLGGQALLHKDALLCTVRPGKLHTDGLASNINVTAVLMWTAFGEAVKFRDTIWDARPKDHELARGFCERLPEYLRAGKIKPNEPKVYPGGLDAIPEGFQDHRAGKISGYKIVYRP